IAPVVPRSLVALCRGGGVVNRRPQGPRPPHTLAWGWPLPPPPPPDLLGSLPGKGPPQRQVINRPALRVKRPDDLCRGQGQGTIPLLVPAQRLLRPLPLGDLQD